MDDKTVRAIALGLAIACEGHNATMFKRIERAEQFREYIENGVPELELTQEDVANLQGNLTADMEHG